MPKFNICVRNKLWVLRERTLQWWWSSGEVLRLAKGGGELAWETGCRWVGTRRTIPRGRVCGRTGGGSNCGHLGDSWNPKANTNLETLKGPPLATPTWSSLSMAHSTPSLHTSFPCSAHCFTFCLHSHHHKTYLPISRLSPPIQPPNQTRKLLLC